MKYIYVYITEWLCYRAKMNTTLQFYYTSFFFWETFLCNRLENLFLTNIAVSLLTSPNIVMLRGYHTVTCLSFTLAPRTPHLVKGVYELQALTSSSLESAVSYKNNKLMTWLIWRALYNLFPSGTAVYKTTNFGLNMIIFSVTFRLYKMNTTHIITFVSKAWLIPYTFCPFLSIIKYKK